MSELLLNVDVGKNEERRQALMIRFKFVTDSTSFGKQSARQVRVPGHWHRDGSTPNEWVIQLRKGLSGLGVKGNSPTRIGRNSDRVRQVLETLIQQGAPETILRGRRTQRDGQSSATASSFET
jgi:hypothetical protein